MITHKNNVTLRYQNYEDGGMASFDTVKIYLFGKEKDISKVEEIILKAAKDYSKKN